MPGPAAVHPTSLLLPPALLAAADALVTSGRARSRSEAMRLLMTQGAAALGIPLAA